MIEVHVRLAYNTSMGKHWNMSEEGRDKISAYAKERYKNSTTLVKCKNCNKEYRVSYARLRDGRGKYCSRPCKGLDTQGKSVAPQTEFKKGHQPWNAGTGKFADCIVCGKSYREQPNKKNLHCSVACREITIGDDIGYGGLHDWVRRILGRPKMCEMCGFYSDNPKLLNWANKTGDYKRDVNDWIRLCRKCHHRYDDISNKGWATRRIRA